MWGRILCFFGRHAWRLQSGLPADDRHESIRSWIHCDYDFYRVCRREDCRAYEGVGERYD